MREAAVRLTLSNGQFITSMKQAGDQVQNVAQKGKRSMDTFGASADNVRSKVSALAGAARNAITLAASLGGAFTVGNAVRDALALQRTYRQIAFGVKDARGEMLRAADVQRIVTRSAALTGQANAAMAQSFSDLLDATGDLDFAEKVLAAVGTTATGTGKGLDVIATAADQLHTKFGVSAADMLDTLAQVFGAAKQGGPKFEEFAGVMADVGAELNAAGLDGKRGLDFMLGSLVQTDDAFKSLPKQVAGLKAVLRGLSESGELNKLAAKIGITGKSLIDEKDAIGRLRKILGTGERGVKALLGSMKEGEEKRTMEILFIEPFQKALADAQKSGLKGKAAIDRALLDFDHGIAAFGKATMSGAEMQKRAEEERKSPEMQLTDALNKLSNAFANPVIIKAIEDLSASLPKLAEHIAAFVAFAAEHPVLAGAGAAGLKFGGDMIGGMVSDALSGALASGGSAVLKKMLGKGGGAAAGGVAGAAGAAAGALAEGTGIPGITTDMISGFLPKELAAAGLPAKGAGFMGKGLVGSAAAAGPWLAAIAAAGVAGGVAIDHAYTKEGDVMGELQSATAAGFGGGSRSQKKAALDRLKKARGAAAQADIGGGVMDHFARLFTDVDSRKGAEDQMKLAGDAIAKLEADLAKPAAEKAAGMASTGEVNIVGKVKVDAESSRLIATATTTALGGKILDVRITNARELGFPVSSGPGASRGPMLAGTPRSGGGV